MVGGRSQITLSCACRRAPIRSSKSEPGRPRSRTRNDAPSCREAGSVVSGHEQTVVGAQTKPDNTDRKETKEKAPKIPLTREERRGGRAWPSGWVGGAARVRAAAPCARPNPSPPLRSGRRDHLQPRARGQGRGGSPVP